MVIRMMASVETYLRRGRRHLHKWALDPKVQTCGLVLLHGGGGFLLSAASLGNYAQPIAMGCICAVTGWRALVMSAGAAVGYQVFWSTAGNQGTIWAVFGGLLSLFLGKRQETKEQPMLLPVTAALLVAVSGLVFQLAAADGTPVAVYCLRIALAAASAVLFSCVRQRKEPMADWIAGGVATLALAQAAPLPWLGLGYVAAGVIGVCGPFPAAALAGVGLDLAQVTALPMTAVLCLTHFLKRIPFRKRWMGYAAPGAAGLAVLLAYGGQDLLPLPGLILGGVLGSLASPKPAVYHRRGETGLAQVRLELGAEVLFTAQQMMLETAPVPIDEEALLEKAKQYACTACAARRGCMERDDLTTDHLHDPLSVRCRKSGRLIPELRRGQEQLRLLQADRKRQAEYRAALVQQYQFLGDYLRSLADSLPRSRDRTRSRYRIEVGVRSANRERANGDRCFAFPGTGCRYYVLLCDGMGTGLGAAHEGQSAGELLRQMLTAGFPAEHALRTINSHLALRGAAGAVTMDLAELHLDSGRAAVYKWGAAPSYLLQPTGPQKIGTATPPPGIDITSSRETVEKLSLCRGEALILLSDGAEKEGILRHLQWTPDAPPGELAAEILERSRSEAQDDATAAVIRLHRSDLATS